MSAAPISSSRQSTASRRWVKFSRASITPGSLTSPLSILRMQPAQPTPSTANVICAAPVSLRSTNCDRSSVSAISSAHFKIDAVPRAEHFLAVTRQLDDEIPLAGRDVGIAMKAAGGILGQHNAGPTADRSAAPTSPRPACGERRTRGIARGHLKRVAGRRRRHLASTRHCRASCALAMATSCSYMRPA